MRTSKIYGLILLSVFSISLVHGSSIPRQSKYDIRMKTQTYNAQNVTLLKSSSGYITSLVFSDSEKIEEAFTGFSNGWELIVSKNILYIKPVSPEGAESVVPNHLWNTNLMVKSNKRFYVFDLEVVDEKERNKSYVVAFNYPDEENQRREYSREQQRKIQEKREVNRELNKLQMPKNWNYSARVKQGSMIIQPNFVYDDGTNTYLGFDKSKTMPSVFQLDESEGNKEILVNTSMKDYSDRYKILVVNSVKPAFVLRQGEKVIAIYNKGFNKYVDRYKNTVSDKVEREIIDNDDSNNLNNSNNSSLEWKKIEER